MNDSWKFLVAVEGLAIAALFVLLVGVMRHVGSLLLVLNPGQEHQVAGGPAIGAKLAVPKAADMGSLVVFVGANCPPCRVLQPSFATFARHNEDVALTVVVAAMPDGSHRVHALAIGPEAMPDDEELVVKWDVPGTPYAVALDSDQKVRIKGVVNSLEQMEQMAATLRSLEPDVTPEAVATGVGLEVLGGNPRVAETP